MNVSGMHCTRMILRRLNPAGKSARSTQAKNALAFARAFYEISAV
jgi:hypothetical protein